MEEFLTKLYSYEYFSLYLIGAIVVLIILFFIILFFGKKDQKEREIEATKKLMKIDESLITEQPVSNNSENEQQSLENDTIIVPTIDTFSEEEQNNEVPTEISAPEINNSEFPEVDDTPIVNLNETNAFKEEHTEVDLGIQPDNFEPVLFNEEEKPLVVDEPVVQNEEPELPNNFEPSNEINVPEFNYEEIIKNVEQVIKDDHEEVKKGPEVFSSVYVPEKNNEVVKQDSDDEIELPTLKKDIKENSEIPQINSFNFDEISGETYDIK